MTLQQRELLHIIQGRLEGIALGCLVKDSAEDRLYSFLMDTAEMIVDLLNEDEYEQ